MNLDTDAILQAATEFYRKNCARYVVLKAHILPLNESGYLQPVKIVCDDQAECIYLFFQPEHYKYKILFYSRYNRFPVFGVRIIPSVEPELVVQTPTTSYKEWVQQHELENISYYTKDMMSPVIGFEELKSLFSFSREGVVYSDHSDESHHVLQITFPEECALMPDEPLQKLLLALDSNKSALSELAKKGVSFLIYFRITFFCLGTFSWIPTIGDLQTLLDLGVDFCPIVQVDGPALRNVTSSENTILEEV